MGRDPWYLYYLINFFPNKSLIFFSTWFHEFTRVFMDSLGDTVGYGVTKNSKFKISNFFNSNPALVIYVRKTNGTIPSGFHMNSDYFWDVDLFWKMVVKIHVSS